VQIFKSLRFYLFTAVASAVMTFAAGHPGFIPHDLAVWLLGVVGHAIGAESKNGTAA